MEPEPRESAGKFRYRSKPTECNRGSIHSLSDKLIHLRSRLIKIKLHPDYRVTHSIPSVVISNASAPFAFLSLFHVQQLSSFISSLFIRRLEISGKFRIPFGTSPFNANLRPRSKTRRPTRFFQSLFPLSTSPRFS